MRIKRFEAKNTQAALAMVKKEMGEDAVILATRTLDDQKAGPARKGWVEIVAARDYDLDDIVINAMNSDEHSSAPSQTYDYKAVRQKEPAITKRTQEDSAPTQKVHSEAHDLRLRFANLVRRRPLQKQQTPAQQEGRPLTSKKENRRPDPAAVQHWRNQLVDKIQLQSSAGGASGPAIIALVGATGVGKTTTAAKLAAWYSLRLGKRVALLSMDCYRIGATDQIRTYARIMRLPCEIVLRKEDLQRSLHRHEDKDVIIIDTAGKSPYDGNHIQELQEWFAPCGARIEPHLVLSATTKKEDLLTSLKSYSKLEVSSLILSKLDETRAYAALCQQIVAAKLPVSYLCTGQRVPEDFMVASKDFLDKLFKQGWSAAASCLGNEVPQ